MESPADAQSADPRLPDDVTPDRYELTLAPDLEAATFQGSVDIAVTVHQSARAVVCNAAELTVEEAWVETADGRRVDASPVLDADAERLTLELDTELAPGTAVVHLGFAGVLNDRLRGFYRSTFEQDDQTRTIAVTQFEPTDARRAFPCWDEPAHKAVFAVALDVDDDLLALSNGREIRREPLDDGRVRVFFADTMPMSTYLVAFVVGPLEISAATEVDGVPLRIVHRPGQAHLAQFAAEIGAFSLRYFADYYGIAYPGDKLDMIAVPDFAFGAMENLGCVIYRETLLLVDPDTATQTDLQGVADTVAHELAHMWFGDLVTMEWWNGIWLNEAFATFMEMKTTAAFRPEWNRWQFFGRERASAFDVDALATTRPIEFPVHSPDDAEAMFDVLTYQKGSAIVRMLEQYLGEDIFRDGIRQYLSTHQYGNTETSDLWDALEAVSGEPVRDLADRWIFQAGHPVVDVTRDGDTVSLSQRLFRFAATHDSTENGPGGSWPVPVVLRSGDAEHRVIVDEAVNVAVGDAPFVLANGGGHGFFRSSYDQGTRQDVLDAFADLAPLERFSMIDDAGGLLLAGDLDLPAVQAVVERLAAIGNTDAHAWQHALGVTATIGRVTPAAHEDAWNTWVVDTIGPVLDAIGSTPRDGDDVLRRELRGSLITALSDAGAATVTAVVDEHFERALRGDDIDPAFAAGVVRAGARAADAGRFASIVDRFRDAPTPQAQLRALYAAARAEDEAVFGEYLQLIGSEEVRSQNLAFAVRAALSNPMHGGRSWTWTTEAWPDLDRRMPFNSWHRLLEGITTFSDRALASAVDRHLEEHPIPQAIQLVAQHRERMWVNVALAERLAEQFGDALS